MSNGQDQPFDKGGVVGRMFGAGSAENGKGLMAVVWVAPATLEEFLKALSDPTKVEAIAKKLEEQTAKLKKAGGSAGV